MFLGPSSTQHQESTKNQTPVCSPRVLLTFNGEVTAVQHLPCLQFSKASHRVPGTPAAAVTWSQEPAQNSSGPLVTAGCEHTHTQRPREAQPPRFGLLSRLHQMALLGNSGGAAIIRNRYKHTKAALPAPRGLICFLATQPAPRWGKSPVHLWSSCVHHQFWLRTATTTTCS